MWFFNWSKTARLDQRVIVVNDDDHDDDDDDGLNDTDLDSESKKGKLFVIVQTCKT